MSQDKLTKSDYNRYAIFVGCLGTITLTTLLDLYLSLKYSEYLLRHEQNIVAVLLIRLVGVSPFTAMKLAGLLLALLILITVYRYKASTGLMVILPVTVFQVWLALHLLLAEPGMYDGTTGPLRTPSVAEIIFTPH